MENLTLFMIYSDSHIFFNWTGKFCTSPARNVNHYQLESRVFSWKFGNFRDWRAARLCWRHRRLSIDLAKMYPVPRFYFQLFRIGRPRWMLWEWKRVGKLSTLFAGIFFLSDKWIYFPRMNYWSVLEDFFWTLFIGDKISLLTSFWSGLSFIVSPGICILEVYHFASFKKNVFFKQQVFIIDSTSKKQ